MGLHQSKKLLHSKANTIKTQRQYTEWKKIAGNCISCESESRSVVSDSLRPHGLYNLWNSPGQNTGVGILSLLQGIISTQGSNPGLLHCRRILYQLSQKEAQDFPILYHEVPLYKIIPALMAKSGNMKKKMIKFMDSGTRLPGFETLL